MATDIRSHRPLSQAEPWQRLLKASRHASGVSLLYVIAARGPLYQAEAIRRVESPRGQFNFTHANGRRGGLGFLPPSVCSSARYFKNRIDAGSVRITKLGITNAPRRVLETTYFGVKRSKVK